MGHGLCTIKTVNKRSDVLMGHGLCTVKTVNKRSDVLMGHGLCTVKMSAMHVNKNVVLVVWLRADYQRNPFCVPSINLITYRNKKILQRAIIVNDLEPSELTDLSSFMTLSRQTWMTNGVVNDFLGSLFYLLSLEHGEKFVLFTLHPFPFHLSCSSCTSVYL